jgi:hypothetical protein
VFGTRGNTSDDLNDRWLRGAGSLGIIHGFVHRVHVAGQFLEGTDCEVQIALAARLYGDLHQLLQWVHSHTGHALLQGARLAAFRPFGSIRPDTCTSFWHGKNIELRVYSFNKKL